jgi:hypothetical protein
MKRNPEALMLEIVRHVQDAVRTLGYTKGSFARKSYANGQWQVAVDIHPEIAPFRSKFFQLAVK